MAVGHWEAGGVTGVPQVSEDHLLSLWWHHPPRLQTTKDRQWRTTETLQRCEIPTPGLYLRCGWLLPRAGWLKPDGREWLRLRWSTWLPLCGWTCQLFLACRSGCLDVCSDCEVFGDVWVTEVYYVSWTCWRKQKWVQHPFYMLHYYCWVINIYLYNMFYF